MNVLLAAALVYFMAVVMVMMKLFILIPLSLFKVQQLASWKGSEAAMEHRQAEAWEPDEI